MPRNHKSEYARRNELARQRGFRSYAQQRRYQRLPSRLADWLTLPESAKDRRGDALAALRVARTEHLSIEEAAAREGISAAAVLWWGGPAVERVDSAHHRPTRADRLLSVHPLLVDGELQFVATRGSGAAARAQAAFRAQRAFLEGVPGSQADLAKLAGARIGGKVIETDPAILGEIGRRGVLEDLADMYRAWVS